MSVLLEQYTESVKRQTEKRFNLEERAIGIKIAVSHAADWFCFLVAAVGGMTDRPWLVLFFAYPVGRMVMDRWPLPEKLVHEEPSTKEIIIESLAEGEPDGDKAPSSRIA